jgi:hypothetical protein
MKKHSKSYGAEISLNYGCFGNQFSLGSVNDSVLAKMLEVALLEASLLPIAESTNWPEFVNATRIFSQRDGVQSTAIHRQELFCKPRLNLAQREK